VGDQFALPSLVGASRGQKKGQWQCSPASEHLRCNEKPNELAGSKIRQEDETRQQPQRDCDGSKTSDAAVAHDGENPLLLPSSSEAVRGIPQRVLMKSTGYHHEVHEDQNDDDVTACVGRKEPIQRCATRTNKQ